MPHGAACTCYLVTTRKSHDHRYHQTSLSRARDGTGGKKRKGKKDQREWLCMFQNGKPVSDFIHVLHACCVGRNFCGYLILRLFPNRKNLQNIVPAKNSNNLYQKLLEIEKEIVREVARGDKPYLRKSTDRKAQISPLN